MARNGASDVRIWRFNGGTSYTDVVTDIIDIADANKTVKTVSYTIEAPCASGTHSYHAEWSGTGTNKYLAFLYVGTKTVDTTSSTTTWTC